MAIHTFQKNNVAPTPDSIGHAKQEIRAGGSDTILSSMFTTIYHGISITNSKWNHLMNAYLIDPKNGIPRNNKDQSSARGNLHKELFKPKMTWKVFCKGMRFLNIVRFEIQITAFHTNGTLTVHKKTVDLGSPLEISESPESK